MLSPATENDDRGRKRLLYQRVPTLRTIVLIAAEEPSVETVERQADGSCIDRPDEGLDATVPLPGIEAEMPLAAPYDGIGF